MKIIKYIFPLLIIVLGFVIYSNVINGPFLFDDEGFVADNYWIRDMSNFIRSFASTRYIGFLSFGINYYVGGVNTFGYHIVNIVIHIINALLVYLLIQFTVNRLKDTEFEYSDSSFNYIAITVSLIFLVHPIQTQAVSYITQRFTSLATLFYLSSLTLYIKARTNGQEKNIYIYLPLYILSIISSILAMKTKEICFTLPFVILLYEFTFLNNDDSRTRTRFYHLLPFLLALCIIPLNFLLTQDTGDITTSQDKFGTNIMRLQLLDINNISRYVYVLTQFRVILTYIRLLILPINQTFEYDYPLSNSLFEPATFISFIFIILIFSFAVYVYFRSRITHHTHGLLISFGMAWFFITLSIESSIIPIKDVIFEHRLYLPSTGFILSATSALSYGVKRFEKYYSRSIQDYFLPVVAVIVIVFAFSTYKRNVLWNDGYLMQIDHVKKSPNRAAPHNYLGMEYYKQKRFDDAIEEYKKAIILDSEYIYAYNNLGDAYYELGRLNEAIGEYQEIMRLKPKYAFAYNNLGNAYYELGQVEEAIELYQKAIILKPDNVVAYYNLGFIFTEFGRTEDAIKLYKNIISLKPDLAPGYYNLGLAYEKKGLKEEAIKELNAAIKINPDFKEARLALDRLYVKP